MVARSAALRPWRTHRCHRPLRDLKRFRLGGVRSRFGGGSRFPTSVESKLAPTERTPNRERFAPLLPGGGFIAAPWHTLRVESASGRVGNSERAMSIRDRRIVVVNDDGIDAHGLSILERAARRCCDDVWVVAPAENQSGRGRALSWRQDVQVEPRGERRFAVHGTPADCVLVALNGLLGRAGRRPRAERCQCRIEPRERHRQLRHRGRVLRGGGAGRARHRVQPETGRATRSEPLGLRGTPDRAPVASSVRRLVLAAPGAERELPRAVGRRGGGGARSDALRLARRAHIDRRAALDSAGGGSSTSTRFGKTSRTSRAATSILRSGATSR